MEFMTLDLCLFGDGGGDGAAATGDAGTQSGAVEVVLGKGGPDQPQPDDQSEPAQTLTDRSAEFDRMISGDYKEEFAKRTQQIINSRFKASKAMERQIASMQPVMQALAARYGLDANDPNLASRAMQALDSDDAWLEDEADRQGLTVAQLKENQRRDAELNRLRTAMASHEREQAAANQYEDWLRQGEAVAQIYPGFDVQAEADANPEFVALLQKGINVQTAYEITHKDELIGGAIQHAVQTAQKRTVDNIRARGMRPDEAGAGRHTQAARIVKSDPAEWSAEEVSKAAEMARMGKKIYL